MAENTYQYLMCNTDSDMIPLICQSLEESGHTDMKLLLESQKSSELIVLSNQHRTVEYHGGNKSSKVFRFNKTDVDEVDSTPISPGRVKLGVQRLDLTPPRPYGAYKMGSRPKGYALIINIELFPNDPKLNRTGSKLDFDKLVRLFTELGYDVEKYQDLTAAQISEKTERFAKEEKHASVDSCVVFIMTHGISDEDNIRFGKKYMNIQGSDLQYINSLEIINHFVWPSSNVFGKEKPIMFFFQSCRGASKDFGQPPKCTLSVTTESRRSTTDGSVKKKPTEFEEKPVKGRRYDHMLIVNACIPGYVSLRYPDTGAWFVEHLVDVFQQHAWEYDIDAMLSLVDEKIRHIVCDDNGMQTTVVEKWGFTKKLYFNPGLYDNEGSLTFEEATNQVADVENNVASATRKLEGVCIALDGPTNENAHTQPSTPPLL